MKKGTIKIAVFSRYPFTKIVPEKSTLPEFQFIFTESVDEADVILVDEGLLTQTEQKIVNAFANTETSMPSPEPFTITLQLSSDI